MYREIDETYVENEGEDRTEEVISILSDGIYDYLKLNGYLKADTMRKSRIKQLIKNVRILSSSVDDESND